jgi:hypothetical protein
MCSSSAFRPDTTGPWFASKIPSSALNNAHVFPSCCEMTDSSSFWSAASSKLTPAVIGTRACNAM